MHTANDGEPRFSTSLFFNTPFPPTTVEVGGEVRILPHPSRAQFLRQMKARLGTAIIRRRAEIVRRWALYVPPEYLPESTRSVIATKLRASRK